jgi:hypothetical protein
MNYSKLQSLRYFIACVFVLCLSTAFLLTLNADVAIVQATGESSVQSNPRESSEQSNPGSQSVFTLTNPLQGRGINSIGGLAMSFVEIISYIVVLIAVLAFIYVGFQYIIFSAQGNSAKIKELHKWLLWIVVGTAIVIGARVLVEIVINTISATGTVSPGVIQSVSNL